MSGLSPGLTAHARRRVRLQTSDARHPLPLAGPRDRCVIQTCSGRAEVDRSPSEAVDLGERRVARDAADHMNGHGRIAVAHKVRGAGAGR
jgi:hypothetical protein